MKAFVIVLALAAAAVQASPVENDKILDCITNPCLTVPGVGKLKGTKKVSTLIFRCAGQVIVMGDQ